VKRLGSKKTECAQSRAEDGAEKEEPLYRKEEGVYLKNLLVTRGGGKISTSKPPLTSMREALTYEGEDNLKNRTGCRGEKVQEPPQKISLTEREI